MKKEFEEYITKSEIKESFRKAFDDNTLYKIANNFVCAITGTDEMDDQLEGMAKSFEVTRHIHKAIKEVTGTKKEIPIIPAETAFFELWVEIKENMFK